ncbi:extracellular solute-binding protein [Herbaspirillum sp. YR522]|uniref:extracellular solute-binding protein n=1 Tax=Herbaspirillum sp. YR522 TaxID=1144342 RepID=UPI00026FCD9C|nr:extracellular solute-binding protein [Herbaspirillum sp. YR522]EJM99699.1 ABC-type sugar transport system, periplasmic component [Herbaspirillum sp. YR522]
MSSTLKGMTWNHARGIDPLVAASAAWHANGGSAIDWESRSLQDFETFPVEQLARQYDLIVIDHPHVGQITREHCLQPFDEQRLAGIASGSVGASFESYHWQGQQWALPVDAATQVMAWRADLLARAPATWDEVMALALAKRVAIPMRAPHSLMSLYTLCGQLGAPGRVEGPDLFDAAAATRAYGWLQRLVAQVGPQCFDYDPIAVFELMAQPDCVIACAPLAYGYINYALEGFRPARLHFTDIPSLEGSGPDGSALGGTGLAVSAYSQHIGQATEFALWVAGASAQKDLYARSGGQAGHSAAWDADAPNALSADFYRATRATLDGAWVRPRHDGYMAYQQAASERLNAGLQRGEPGDGVIAELNLMFRESLR